MEYSNVRAERKVIMTAQAIDEPSISISPTASRDLVAAVCAMLGVGLFASKAILVVAYPLGVDATTLLLLRMLWALPVFILVGWYMRKRFGPLRLKEYIQAGVIGLLGYYLASWLDFAGLARITAGLERMVLYVYPTVVVLLAWVNGLRPSKQVLSCLLVTYVGIVLCFAGELELVAMENAREVTIGTLLVVASAICFAGYLFIAGKHIKRLGSTRFTSIAFCAAGLGIVIHGLFAGSVAKLPGLSTEVWGYGIALGLLCTAIPAYLMNFSLGRLGATRVALIGSMGPVMTIVLAWIFLHERPSSVQAVGMVITIIASTAMALAKNPPTQTAEKE